MASEGLVSAIIPTYNRKELLASAINSVKSQNYPKIEILVIDDNSTDGTQEFIRENHPDVRLFSNKKNMGPSYNKNLGILKSRGEYLLFMDSDSEFVNEHSIFSMVSALKSDPTIGSIGGDGTLEGGKIVASCGRKKTWYGLGKNVDIREGMKECDYLPTSNCMTRKSVAENVGGFDPHYFYMTEDREFGLLIKRLGFKNIVSFDGALNHKFSEINRTGT